MQAVGQLAGGVAHDFNNILTAILGTCDLMLMRHAPGDSDYDDIQQIRSNSIRAPTFTRQMLAFSRQQTLRPQVLQLPDVVARFSHLLDRLLGERIKLEGQARPRPRRGPADPGQLEQVISTSRSTPATRCLAKDPSGRRHPDPADLSRLGRGRPRMSSDVLRSRLYRASRSPTPARHPRQSSARLRALLHHQGGREGDRARPFDGLRHRQAVGRLHLRRIQAAQGNDLLDLPAGAPRPARRSTGQGQRQVKPSELWGSGTVLLVEDEAMVRTVAERALTRTATACLSPRMARRRWRFWSARARST
jgi:two-component system cell cycle sensor histidine kinase/response regulator CckA